MQQSFKMLSRRNGLQSLPSFLIVLVYLLLQTHSCKGQSQVIGPSQPIVAKVGDDIILPCHLEPAVDVVSFPLEWTRPDLNPVFVHMRRAGQDLIDTKHPSYVGRTSVSNDELRNGNISLKLSKLKPYDAGRYKCYIPKLKTGASVELVVGAASSPSISLSGLDQKKGGVVLQCNSTGWYPEPEVFWLDGEGNLLSAGPTETVRGPDDLYTVSSRVTVEKRHSNSFTCRVQQNSTNQTRETLIHVPDDFFEVQSSSSSTTVGLAVSLAVCILVILILGFFVWKLKTKRSHIDETNEGEKKNCKRSEDQVVTVEESERQKLLTHETVQMKDLNKGQAAGIRPELQEEKKRREEEVERKNQELQKKTDEMKNKDETIKKLLQERRDKEKAQSEVMMLNHHLESKDKEFPEERNQLQAKIQEWENKFKEEEKKREKAEKEVKDLKTELDGLKAEVNKLTEEKKRSEEERQKLLTNIRELEQKLQDEKKKSERDQRELKEERKRNTELEKKLSDLQQLHEEKKKKEEQVKELGDATAKRWFPSSSKKMLQKKKNEDTETEVENLKKQLETKETELDTKSKEIEDKQAEVQKLQEEIQKMETNLQTMMEEQESNNVKLESSGAASVQPSSSKPEVHKAANKQSKKTTESDGGSSSSGQQDEKKQNSSSLSQNSTTEPVVVFRVDPRRRYIQLRNTSKEDQQLGGWTLKIQVNDEEPVIHTFEDPFNLKTGKSLTVGYCSYDSRFPRAQLVLKDLKSWRNTDKPQVSLISKTGEIQ